MRITQKDLTIALLKAASAQIPYLGALVSEGIGAIDQRATLDQLNSRLEWIEQHFLQIRPIPNAQRALKPFQPSANYGTCFSLFQTWLISDNDFDELSNKFLEHRPPEFEQLNTGTQLKLVHDLLEECDRRILTAQGKENIILIGFDVLSSAKPNDDIYQNFGIGTEDGQTTWNGYLANSWFWLGLHLRSVARYLDSIACLTSAIAHGARPYYAMINIANSFGDLGCTAYRIEQLARIARLYPHSITALYNLASAHEEYGSIKEARHFYRKFVERYKVRVTEGASFREGNEFYQGQSERWHDRAIGFLEANDL